MATSASGATALTTVLMSADPSTTLSAVAQAIGVIDRQIAGIRYQQYGGFPGAEQMSQATRIMQDAAGGWTPTKQGIVGAAQLVVQGGPTAATLGGGATTVSALSGALSGFRQGPLAQAIAAFTRAQAQFDNFNSAMNNAYTASANANQAAASFLQQAQIRLQIARGQLQADQSKVDSAGSIVEAIFTFGISLINEMHALQNEVDQLNQQQWQLSEQESAYALSLGSFQNALGAVKQASYALDTVGTAFQQLGNAIDDITSGTSTTLVVMQAYLKMFQAQYAGAVVSAQTLISA
jgi:hypothetical protein